MSQLPRPAAVAWLLAYLAACALLGAALAVLDAQRAPWWAQMLALLLALVMAVNAGVALAQATGDRRPASADEADRPLSRQGTRTWGPIPLHDARVSAGPWRDQDNGNVYWLERAPREESDER